MPTARVRLPDDLAPLLVALRAELKVPATFPDAVLHEATSAAASPPDATAYADETARVLVTLDPPGSTDLDQALGLRRRDGGGFELDYAIADVGAFVRPGGPLDAETHERGETLYLPDGRAPLHPDVIGTAAGSLLPDQVRRAVLWTIAIDASGDPVGDPQVRRALVRSRAQLDYVSTQAALDAGTASEPITLLPEIGALLASAAEARGAVDLPNVEQDVLHDADGYHLELRSPLACEGHNAQLSLLTGRAAAAVMLRAGVGLLRTVPPPTPDQVAPVRRAALALGVPWPEDEGYPEVIRGLDPADPHQAALLTAAGRLLRGSGYLAFGPGIAEVPSGAKAEHAAVAAPYAHATAPLRRLADRYVSEICLSTAAGGVVPTWVTDALPHLPHAMAAADQRGHAIERAVLDLAEAALLQTRVGDVLDAVVLSTRPDSALVQVADPPVRSTVAADGLVAGSTVRLRVVSADTTKRTVDLLPVS